MKKIIYFIFICIVSLNNTVMAGGFKLGVQGHKQLSMGHTGVGFAQDGATVYFNPAGMSFVGPQINIGAVALMPATSFLESSTNTLTDAGTQVFSPFAAYGNFKLSRKINFGVGIYTPFGSGIKYPYDWAGRYILTQIDLQTVFFQPTLSYKISDKFSLGAGLIYAHGNMNLEKDLPVLSGSETNVAHARLSGKGSGIGFNAGMYLKGKKVHFGITYHSKVLMKLKAGDVRFSNIPSALKANFPDGNTFNAELPLPAELAMGSSFRLAEKTVLAFDINYTFWKSFDSLGFDYAQNTTSLSDAKSPRMYENAFAVRLGLQHQVHKSIQIRGGFFYDRTPVQDGYVAPELPDNNKIGLTCGASFQLRERFFIDCSLLYENVAKRTQRNKETGLEGTFQTRVIAPGLGITYLLQKRTVKRKRY